MGSSARLIEEDARRIAAWARLRELCPPGWHVVGDKLTAVETARGYWLRKQTLTAGCVRRDCRRRCDLDLADLVRSEHADAPLEAVVERLRCRHWRGCQFALRPPLYPEGVPLICYLDIQGVGIDIGCVKCPRLRRLTPEQVIRALLHAGRGDGGTGIHVIADKIRGPCPSCGGRRFVAALVEPPAMGTPSYPGGASVR